VIRSAWRMPVLSLNHGENRCELLPTLGGSIASWGLGGQQLLRAASEPAIRRDGAFGTGSFPLVPYSNRIASGHFAWQGHSYVLARNFYPEPHAIHGVGFEQPWTIESSDACSALLSLTYRGGSAWPFPFEAEQRYVLDEDSLTIEMRATNRADEPVPLAFGHHPYFPRQGANLRFSAERVWMNGEDALPTLCMKPFARYDFSGGAPLTRGDVDHCYTGWDGRASISWEGRPFALDIRASSNLGSAVIYINSQLDGFCFEPVPHLNDAINRATPFDMPVVDPGERFESSIVLRTLNAA
jgi:aldose 1-epimerase